MYEVLKLNWDQMMRSEYDFKSNSSKRVIQFHQDEFRDERVSQTSDILIFYNLYNGTPMILIERVEGHLEECIKDEVQSKVENFVIAFDYDDEAGYTDIVCTSNKLYESLTETEFDS